MDSSGIPTHLPRDNANYSFMTFDQSMSPIPGLDLQHYYPVLASKGFNEPGFFGSDSFSHSVQDLSKEASSNRGPYPASLTGDDAEGTNDSTTNHITRPRNAFMLYRSECLAQHKISRDVEHDNRHISRIIGHCWQKLSKEEKAIWKQKADEEKMEHKNKYPNYKFSPVPRSKKPLKRTGKRNGEKDMERCRQVADLLLSGKQGEELAVAIKQIDLENEDDNDHQASTISRSSQSVTNSDVPAFMNPLRRPTGPSPELHPAVSSSSNYHNSYAPKQRSPQHYYPSPPVSPGSPNFMYRETGPRNPFTMGSAYASSPGQVTGIHSGSHSSLLPPYHANRAFPHSTSFNPLHTNEAHVAYTANNEPFLDPRGRYTFL